MKLTSILSLFFVLGSSPSFAANLPIPDQEYPSLSNLLANPGFENGKYGWTASGGATAASNTTAKGLGSYGYDWDSNGAAQTLIATAITIPNGMHGKNGLAYCKVKVPSGTATHTIVVDNGTDALVTAQTLTSSSSAFVTQVLNFIFPTSGSVRLKFTSVASDEPEIYIDSCYLGEATNIGTVAQAEHVLLATLSGDQNIASTSLTSLGFDTATYDPYGGFNTVTHAYTVKKAGRYLVNVCAYAKNFTSTEILEVAIYVDASQTILDFKTTTGTVDRPCASGSINLSVGQVVDTAVKSSADTSYAINASSNDGTYFEMFRFPTTVETVFRPEVFNWRVDANIAGANPSLGVSDQASYVGITNSGLTLANNTGSGVLTAQIPCSTTVSPSGTTCSGGDESVGVSFSLPIAGDVRACATFGHEWDPTDSDILNLAFQIVETPSNDQTISQEGKFRVPLGADMPSSASPDVITTPMHVCGTFSFSSAGQKTLRLFYEQDVTSTPDTNIIIGDASATIGQRDIHWEVYPINQNVVAPVIVGPERQSSTSTVLLDASTAWKDITSISLTAGEWDISGIICFDDGASASITRLQGGISSTSGNSTTGLVDGDSKIDVALPGTARDACGSIPALNVTPTSTTTYYLKAQGIYTVADPNAFGRITARRIR